MARKGKRVRSEKKRETDDISEEEVLRGLMKRKGVEFLEMKKN